MEEKRKVTLKELGFCADKCVFPAVSGGILGRDDDEFEKVMQSFTSTAIVDMHYDSVCMFALRYDGSFDYDALRRDPECSGKFQESKNHIPASEFKDISKLGPFFEYTGTEVYGVLQETKPGYFEIISDKNLLDDEDEQDEWNLTNQFRSSTNKSHNIHWLNDEFYILTMYSPDDSEGCIEFWLGRKSYGKMEYILGIPADEMSLDEAFAEHEIVFRNMNAMSEHIYELLEGEEIESDGEGGFVVVR